jgi:hypothetical protein
MDSRQLWRRRILGFSIVTTVLIVAVADPFNTTHLFNPAWPPHARFHNGMQAWTLLLVSIVSWVGRRRGHQGIAAVAPATFWPSLWLSRPIPGTTVYATPATAEAGIAINLILGVLWLAVTALGDRLSTRSAARAIAAGAEAQT